MSKKFAELRDRMTAESQQRAKELAKTMMQEMLTHAELKAKMLENPGVRKAYDELKDADL